jgi:hypothetical protein
MAQNPYALVLRPRHKWFAAPEAGQEDGWYGPFRKLEDAAYECWLSQGGERIFVTQGRKLTVSEIEEQGADYAWEVDAKAAFEIVLPKIPPR